jgi:hypothetical protein
MTRRRAVAARPRRPRPPPQRPGPGRWARPLADGARASVAVESAGGGRLCGRAPPARSAPGAAVSESRRRVAQPAEPRRAARAKRRCLSRPRGDAPGRAVPVRLCHWDVRVSAGTDSDSDPAAPAPGRVAFTSPSTARRARAVTPAVVARAAAATARAGRRPVTPTRRFFSSGRTEFQACLGGPCSVVLRASA